MAESIYSRIVDFPFLINAIIYNNNNNANYFSIILMSLYIGFTGLRGKYFYTAEKSRFSSLSAFQ
jgi:hypothetical protein